MDRERLVAVTDLHRSYGDLRAVDGVSFELERGEVLGFLGPNGAGKTTTMQIICGALAPSEGQIAICEIDLLDQPRKAKAQLGYLPERPPLYRELTIDEYLGFCASLRHVPRRKSVTAVNSAKERCGLADAGRRLIGNLSKGYQQRVGIAQAIIHHPAVVVLDEPTVGLDPIQIREIRALIRELGRDHGVILSTHILPEVQAVCDRVQIIHQGRLVLNQRVEELTHNHQEQCVRLTFRRPPALETLMSIPGIDRVEIQPGDSLKVYHSRNSEILDALVAESVRDDWGLRELVPEHRTLEEIFVALTCGEESALQTTERPAT